MPGFPFPQSIWITEEEAVRLVGEITGCRRYQDRNEYRQLAKDGRLMYRGNDVSRQSVVDALFTQHQEPDARYRWMMNDLIRHHKRQGQKLAKLRAAEIVSEWVFPHDADQAKQMIERIRR